MLSGIIYYYILILFYRSAYGPMKSEYIRRNNITYWLIEFKIEIKLTTSKINEKRTLSKGKLVLFRTSRAGETLEMNTRKQC